MTLVLTGGGTAGHVMPNIALLPYLREYFEEVYYIGTEDGMEKSIAERYGVPFMSAEAVKLDRLNLLKNFKIPVVLPRAVLQAKKILKEITPSAVYSKGGYAALPTVLAAELLKIPVIVHESDRTLGAANKLSAPFCKKVLLSFDDEKLKDGKKFVYAGIPVRDEIFKGDGDTLKKALRVPAGLPVVLIIGGSLGAQGLNECVYKALHALTSFAFVIHITGKTGISGLEKENYRSFEFVENIGDFFAAADAVISRAGANAAAELTALNKRIIFVPLPKTASRGDQINNAEYYAERGLAEVIRQENLDENTLTSAVKNSLKKPVRQVYNEQPNRKIAEIIYNTAALNLK